MLLIYSLTVGLQPQGVRQPKGCPHDELRQRNKVKTHLRMCFQSAALGAPTKKPAYALAGQHGNA